ncbi:hypothetical protein BJ742DRAFT_814126 [Cladochytrium replicatum]|nr:hypothetical protein BJ742DRAFT_814126 [Cladochytrium replicatum]
MPELGDVAPQEHLFLHTSPQKLNSTAKSNSTQSAAIHISDLPALTMLPNGSASAAVAASGHFTPPAGIPRDASATPSSTEMDFEDGTSEHTAIFRETSSQKRRSGGSPESSPARSESTAAPVPTSTARLGAMINEYAGMEGSDDMWGLEKDMAGVNLHRPQSALSRPLDIVRPAGLSHQPIHNRNQDIELSAMLEAEGDEGGRQVSKRSQSVANISLGSYVTDHLKRFREDQLSLDKVDFSDILNDPTLTGFSGMQIPHGDVMQMGGVAGLSTIDEGEGEFASGADLDDESPFPLTDMDGGPSAFGQPSMYGVAWGTSNPAMSAYSSASQGVNPYNLSTLVQQQTQPNTTLPMNPGELLYTPALPRVTPSPAASSLLAATAAAAAGSGLQQHPTITSTSTTSMPPLTEAHINFILAQLSNSSAMGSTTIGDPSPGYNPIPATATTPASNPSGNILQPQYSLNPQSSMQTNYSYQIPPFSTAQSIGIDPAAINPSAAVGGAMNVMSRSNTPISLPHEEFKPTISSTLTPTSPGSVSAPEDRSTASASASPNISEAMPPAPVASTGPPEDPLKKYKCPRPGCTKSYKNSNGLKYHLAHHNDGPSDPSAPRASKKNSKAAAATTQVNDALTFVDDGSGRVVSGVQGLGFPSGVAASNIKRSGSSTSINTMGGEEEEKGEVYKPYWCRVPNCNKKYKNLNGLKYHLAHAHADLDPKEFLKDCRVPDPNKANSKEDKEARMARAAAAKAAAAAARATGAGRGSENRKDNANVNQMFGSLNLNTPIPTDPARSLTSTMYGNVAQQETGLPLYPAPQRSASAAITAALAASSLQAGALPTVGPTPAVGVGAPNFQQLVQQQLLQQQFFQLLSQSPTMAAMAAAAASRAAQGNAGAVPQLQHATPTLQPPGQVGAQTQPHQPPQWSAMQYVVAQKAMAAAAAAAAVAAATGGQPNGGGRSSVGVGASGVSTSGSGANGGGAGASAPVAGDGGFSEFMRDTPSPMSEHVSR